MIASLFAEGDWRLMKRLTEVLASVLVLAAGFCHLQRTYQQKFYDVTGEAQWIWARHDLSLNEPVAFYAARELVLPEKRAFTHLKIAADPEYTLWVNGRNVASVRMNELHRRLDLYDISPLVKTGRNRIVVAVRAPQGFGGLVAAVDLAPENAAWLVTDGSWKIYRRWDPAILAGDVAGSWQRPVVIGEPPVGRWDFLDAVPHPLEERGGSTLAPSRSFLAEAEVPSIRTSEGIAVAVADPATASVFDFGFTRGRVRLTLERPGFGSRMVQLRTINDVREIGLVDWNMRKVVFAPGETVVTLPEERSFRYAMVFARNVKAEVVRSNAER